MGKKLLGSKHVLLIGSDDDVKPYAALLKKSDARITYINEDITWQDKSFVRNVINIFIATEGADRPDAVVAVNPGMNIHIGNVEAEPMVKFARAMKQLKIGLVVLAEPQIGNHLDDYLQEQGMRYRSHHENKQHTPGMVLLEIVRRQNDGKEPSLPNF
ncbi:MAG: hypothetical protein AB7F82_03805 [Alphaproteobacteria bacterium]